MPKLDHRFEDDSVFDENGVLFNQKVARVRMNMRDSTDDGPLDPGELPRRLQMLDAERRRRGPVVTDAAGDSSFLGLRRPGFRYLSGGSHQEVRDRQHMQDVVVQARAAYLHDLENAWRTPVANTGSHAYSGPVEGAACTTNGGFSGTWQTDDESGELVCVADTRTNGNTDGRLLDQLQRDYATVMEAAYQEYSNWVSNQWRTN